MKAKTVSSSFLLQEYLSNRIQPYNNYWWK